MMDIRKKIGRKLRDHRRLMGLSQMEVARRMGLESTAIISRWESGVVLPNIENAMKLSKLYKTLVNQLFWDLDREYSRLLFPDDFTGSCNDP